MEQTSTRDEAERVRAGWRAAAASDDGPLVVAATDALLDFLRAHPVADAPQDWGLLAVDTVTALLTRHRLTGQSGDLAAASRIAEAVWHIDELDPLVALQPLIRTTYAAHDLSVRSDLERWANLCLLELVLDRQPERRRTQLAAGHALMRALRDGAVRGLPDGAKRVPPVGVEHRLWVRFVRDQMDMMAADEPLLRFGWLDVALARACAPEENIGDEHGAAVRAYDAAVAIHPTTDHGPPDHYFWMAATTVAAKLDTSQHPLDAIRLMTAAGRGYAALREADMSVETRERLLEKRIWLLRYGDDPGLLPAQAREARALLQEDLAPPQRIRVLRSLLVTLMKITQQTPTQRDRRELREVAALVRGVQLDADDPAILAALMLAARDERDSAALEETIAMLRPPADRDVTWTHWIAYGRVLLSRARVDDDAAIARSVLQVAERLALVGDEVRDTPTELRRGALAVLARTGERAAAAALVELVPATSDSPLVEILRLDLCEDPPTSDAKLGRRLVALARQMVAGPTEPLSLGEVAFTLVLEYVRVSRRGVLDRLPDATQLTEILDAALLAIDEDADRAVLAAHAVSHPDLALVDRPRLRDQAIEQLRPATADSIHFRLVCGRLLLERFRELGDDVDLDDAAALLLPADGEQHVPDHAPLLISVIDTLRSARPELRRSSDLHRRELFLLQDIAYGPSFDAGMRLDAARRLLETAPRMWPYLASIAKSVTEPLTPDLLAVAQDVVDVLSRAQGITARGAYAAAMSGDIAAAIEMAERGQGLLAAVALRRHGATTSSAAVRAPVLYRRWETARDELAAAMRGELAGSQIGYWFDMQGVASGVPSDPPTRRLDREEYFRELAERSPRIATQLARFRQAQSDLEGATGPLVVEPNLAGLVAHLQSAGSRLCYVLATSWGGVALLLEPTGGMRAVELPRLTEQRCRAWSAAINDDVRWSGGEPVETAEPVRGAAPEPSGITADEVLAAMADALGELAALLGRDIAPVQLVPVGHLASLPLTAALQITRGEQEWFELSVAASGRLHIASAIRSNAAERHAGFLAITDARPTLDRDGRPLSRLPSAAAEGEYLASTYDAEHLTAHRATVHAALRGLESRHRVLHFAVHGDTDRERPEQSCLYLVGEDGRPARLEAKAITAASIDIRLIFLGACWTGRPGQRLPDEAIGFPTILLQSGAAGVIAPSWPIDDSSAMTFATAFYEGWVTCRMSAGQALAVAMRTTRDLHPSSPTWASFSLYGT